MPYRISVRSSAQKELLALPAKLSDRVAEAIDALAENPRPFGYIKLHGSNDLYRVRVSDIRVIYTIDDGIKIVEIRSIRKREDIYRKR
jgi:mRNA interferase RelE/StbE